VMHVHYRKSRTFRRLCRKPMENKELPSTSGGANKS
jgi:hypothetical protein